MTLKSKISAAGLIIGILIALFFVFFAPSMSCNRPGYISSCDPWEENIGAPFVIFFMLLPIVGFLVSAAGIAAGLYGYGSTRFKKLQILGIIICGIGLITAFGFALAYGGPWWGLELGGIRGSL